MVGSQSNGWFGRFWPLPWLEQGWVRISSGLMQFSVLGWLSVAAWRFGWWRSYPTGCAALFLIFLVWRERPPEHRWRLEYVGCGPWFWRW
ncbi:ComEC family competence protein [Serratia odorifera]|uniref:ComEC family competence protein n=1 Tax=Serratia odorifera TaxID=618 RepID=A0A3S5D834_SEROD|nr:hypothetical protein [Serratia odorifera]VDZ64712.1 ComEC family competence protein [Serratia odorifera]